MNFVDGTARSKDLVDSPLGAIAAAVRMVSVPAQL
jgi:hypothetical protein